MSTDAFEYKAASISSAANGKSGVLNLDEAQGIVECFVAGIGNKDSVGDIVHSGAFTKSLMRRKPRVVWGHNWNDPIGKVLEIYEVPPTDPRLPLKMKMAGIGGLFARVQFNLNSEKGREAFANVAFFGEEQEWSIGYKTLRAQYDQKSQANIIYELELYEVSPVLHGANQLTGTISVKAGMPGAPVMEQVPAGPVPMPQLPPMQTEIEQALQKMYGESISVTEVDEENGMVSYDKPGEESATDKYKCHFSRGNNGQFMFGAPERIVVIAKPPAVAPGMPSVEPQRIVRPSQMPSIPVAIKPGPTGGMTVVPLPPVQYDGEGQKPVDKNSLDQEESDLRDALLKIVKRHGKINEDADGIWAGYKPAMQNPVAGIGVKCSNCVFYNKDNSCQIVDMPIEPEGKCRFAIIPPGVVKGDFNMKKQYEFESEEDEDDYVSEFEFKYPGELLVAALRGVVGRKRRKKRKFKHLADFGTYEDEMDPGKPYYLPVPPEAAFHVKQALDPIFDYHRAETYVDIEGIVITDGVSYELIDAIDTALDNLKKKDLIPDGLQVKVSGYRLGRAIGSRMIDRPNRPGIGGARSARRFFTTPGAERFDPRTAVDRNLNGVVGEGIFLRGTPLEQPDPTPDGPGSINNPTMPGDKKPNKPSLPSGEDAAPESAYIREPAKQKPPSPDDYVREPAKPKKTTREDYQLLAGPKKMPKEMQAAQAKGKEYANYLRTRESDRSIEDRIKFDGIYNVLTREGKFSSGGDSGVDNLKPGDVVDTATPEGRAIVDQYYKKMGDQIVALLEEALKNPGKFKWNMPWRGGEHIPRNPTKRNAAQKAWAYQGSNYMLLNGIALNRGYPTNKWAGITQWKRMRGKPKKNAQPVGVLTPILGSQPRQYKYELVYNVADIEGLPPKMYEPEIDLENMSPKARVKNAEDIVAELAPRIRESNVGGAFYSPSGDFINMPEFKTFESAEGYYATLLHEMTHWTSHPTRMNRQLGRNRQDPKYAFEELIAEIGASLLLGMVGISPRIREDHISYLRGWLDSIKSDPNALRRAMTQSQQAVDFMLNRSKTLRRLSGMEDNDRKAKTSVTDSVPLPMLEGYEGAPKVPVSSPIVAGPVSDIDERELADDIADQLSSGGITYEKRNFDVTDMSDMRTTEERRKYGSYTAEERMFAGLQSVFVTDKDGRALTMDGSFSSGNTGAVITPRQGSKAKPVKQTSPTTDMAGLLGLAVPPTQEQRDIIDLGVAAAYGKEKIVVGVDAAAGSGKTTTMKMLAAAIAAEFNTQDIFERFAGDKVSRKQQLFKKAEYLIEKYEGEADEIKKLLPKDPTKMTDKQERSIADAIASLGAKYGYTATRQPKIYYTVFGREARIDAVDAFTPNTGVGTTTQVAYWALRLGVAEKDTSKNKIKNPAGMARKIEISTEFEPKGVRKLRRKGDAEREQATEGYDRAGRKHDSVTVTTTGKTASFEDLGYVQITDGKSMRKLLELSGKPLVTSFRPKTVRRKGKQVTIQEEIVTLPFQINVGGGTGMSNQIPAADLMEWLAIAFRRWTLSADDKVTNKVFTLTARERDDTNASRPMWASKKRQGRTQPLDEQLELNTIPKAWLTEMAGHVQLAVDELLDGNGFVLPTQDQLVKVFLMTDPDLSTNPGAIGNGSRDLLKGVNLPPALGVQQRDIVYVNPSNNLPYETQTDGRGRVIPGRLWTAEEGEPFVVVGIKQGQAKLAKVYASEDDPLSVFAIDEAQDLNEVWQEIIDRNRERVSVITVGDDRQQIMGFAGSKNIMKATNPDFAPKLTQSFRFGSLIGYLGTLILAKENNLINDVFGNGKPIAKEDWKYVEGAADKAARAHINNLVQLAVNGDWAGANGLNEIVKKLYGIDFGPMLNGEAYEAKDAPRKKAHINELKKAATEATSTLMKRLQSKIVDEREEMFFGSLPGMVLGASKEGLLDTGLGVYTDLYVDSAVFLGGRVDDPDLLRDKPNMTEAELAEIVRPIEAKDRPKTTITQNAHEEALSFYKHIDWVIASDAGFAPAQKPPASSLIGNYWTMSEIQRQLRWKKSQVANSLMRIIQPQPPGPGGQPGAPGLTAKDMVRVLQGGLVRRADGNGFEYVPPTITPLRDSLDLAKTDFSETDLSEILASRDRSAKAKGNTALAKIEVIPDNGDGQTNGVYFQLEYDLENGMDSIDENDFEVIVEKIAGQDQDRVRIVSKWGKPADDGSTVPKFEVIAESDEARTTDELTSIAWQRMRHKLVSQSTGNIISSTGRAMTRSSNPIDPRELKYFNMPYRWTGRVILSGDGIDTGRPVREFVDPEMRPKTRAKRLADGPYLVDALQTISRLGLRDISRLGKGVGLKRITADGRGYDGIVIDVGADEARATKVIQDISNAMRKLAKNRKGDTVIQTSYTAKGQEDDFVMILGDFKDPNSDLSQGQIVESKQLFGTIPPGWAEGMHLQYVTVTRPKKKVSIGPRFWVAHFADTPSRKRAADSIRDGIKQGILPKDFDQENELDYANLPAVYKLIQEAAETAGAGNATAGAMSDQFDSALRQLLDRRGDPLSLPDDDVRKYMASIGVPAVATESFLKRRQAVIDEYSDVEGLSETDRRLAALGIMRTRAREIISGPIFDPKSQWADEDETNVVDDVELDEDGNEIIPEGRDTNDILDEGQEKIMTGGDAGVDDDEGDGDAGDADSQSLSSGAVQGFSSGAETGSEGEAGTTTRASRTRATPSGRFGRRLSRFENRSGMQQQLSALELAGIRTDARLDPQDRMRATAYAMQFWDGFDQVGIALDMPTDQDVSRRQSAIINALPEVGRRMRSRRKADGSSVVQIGKTTNNPALENPSSETWMLSVDKLLDTIRIPTRWKRQTDATRGEIVQETLDDGTEGDTRVARVGMYWTQSRPLSVANLRELLGLNVVDEKKLREPNAGLSHDTVRYLLAEIGKQPEFSGWRLFAPVSDAEAEDLGMSPSERLVENIGRANMRDRFIIETFGADAYPFWKDRGGFIDGISQDESQGPRRMISSNQYREFEETDSMRRFNAVGTFEDSWESRDDSEAEVELAYEGTAGATLDEIPVEIARSAPRNSGSRIERRDLSLESLLDHLGIPNEKGWSERLKPVLQEAFGEGVDVGLGPDAIKSWAKDGVPIAYVQEMIRTGVIPNARSVWGSNKIGQKLDEELVAAKPQVYEALTQFIDRSFPDSALNTSESRSFIINSREMPTVLKNAAERKGSSFSKGTGDVPRFSRSQLQEIVDRFNERFGTQHTIEDIFSHEQLREAEKQLRGGVTLYQPNARGRKGSRKVTPDVANS